MDDKPHLSPTQLESYCRCPEAYRRRYVEKEIIPPGIAALQGFAVHRGAETNFRQKIETFVDLPVSDIVDAAAAAFEDGTHGGFAMSDDESSRGASVVLGEAKDATVQMAEVHATQQAPDYQPVMVEERVRITLPNNSHDLLGIIDLADDKGRVTDFKTSGKRKNQVEADGSVQLTVYAAAFKAVTGTAPAEVRLDTIVRTKTKISRDVVSTSREDADFEALANRINAVTKAVEAGIFTPATPNSWWCSPRFCGYWSTCPFINSQREALAEKSDSL